MIKTQVIEPSLCSMYINSCYIFNGDLIPSLVDILKKVHVHEPIPMLLCQMTIYQPCAKMQPINEITKLMLKTKCTISLNVTRDISTLYAPEQIQHNPSIISINYINYNNTPIVPFEYLKYTVQCTQTWQLWGV